MQIHNAVEEGAVKHQGDALLWRGAGSGGSHHRSSRRLGPLLVHFDFGRVDDLGEVVALRIVPQQ